MASWWHLGPPVGDDHDPLRGLLTQLGAWGEYEAAVWRSDGKKDELRFPLRGPGSGVTKAAGES